MCCTFGFIYFNALLTSKADIAVSNLTGAILVEQFIP